MSETLQCAWCDVQCSGYTHAQALSKIKIHVAVTHPDRLSEVKSKYNK